MNRQPLAFDASEYQILFGLTANDLPKKILDFPGGLNSFSAQRHQENYPAVACDEIYTDTIALEKLSDAVLKNTELTSREAVIKAFEADFQQSGKHFYIAGWFPHLPFKDHEFDLLLSSFFLFSNGMDLEACWISVMEMLRVATEVRIYPVSNANLAEVVGPLMLKLQANGFGIEIRSIVFSALPNAAMIRVWSQSCSLEPSQVLAAQTQKC